MEEFVIVCPGGIEDTLLLEVLPGSVIESSFSPDEKEVEKDPIKKNTWSWN